MRRRSLHLLVPVLLAASTAACGGASGGGAAPLPPLSLVGGHAQIGHLTITRAYIPDPATPSLAAAYFTVTNAGPADRLVSVRTAAFRSATLHREVTTARGLEQMVAVPAGAVVPAYGRLVLMPGSYHVMLRRPLRALRQGVTERLTLRFAKAGVVRLVVPVVPATGLPGSTAGSSGDMAGMSK
ncbi:MAG TPA: copper chaperone PCu(A)C [Mycobacteriales bacterium]|nr:copper chaperone PCu(A)C [Mycobacteriales bacterium]